MSRPSDEPGRDLWAEYHRAKAPAAPDLEPTYPPLPANYGGPDLTGDDVAEAERIMDKWPAEHQDLSVALAWARGWRP